MSGVIENWWDKFEEDVMPKHVLFPESQRTDMRHAYYAGVAAMFIHLKRCTASAIPADALADHLNTIETEIESYIEAVRAGKA